MSNILAVFIGGGLGALIRYLVGICCATYLKVNLPIATFIVNIIGCLILGFLYVLFLEKSQLPAYLKPLLTVGFCGGLTTFSTFSLEIFTLVEHNQIIQAVIYLILSIILGIIAVMLGGLLCRQIII